MGAVSGDINTAPMHAVNAADLTSRVIAGLRSGDRAYVANKAGTLEGPNFFLDTLSVLLVDGVGVLATSSGVGRWLSLSIYSGGSSPLLQVEPVLVTIPGQVAFTLPSLPASDVEMFVNGVYYEEGVDFTRAGTAVSWVNIIVLDPTDRVVFAYQA